MVQRCCVPFCETKVGDADINGVKVRFHRMPMVPERFQHWRAKITNNGQYKPEPELTVNSRICSKHFTKEDYLDNRQKPVTGNHILTKDAIPTRFRWSSENCDVSAAIPFVRRVKPQQQTHLHSGMGQMLIRAFHKDGSCVEHSPFEKQTQCSFEDERLKNEISRKNSIIQQLLERISQLEAEHKATTQILLKESMQGTSSMTTSVIRSTSPASAKGENNNNNERDYYHQQQQAQQHHITHHNNNQQVSNNTIINTNSNTTQYTNPHTPPKRRKVQYDEDENIHYVLLSLSEKVVRHDMIDSNSNVVP